MAASPWELTIPGWAYRSRREPDSYPVYELQHPYPIQQHPRRPAVVLVVFEDLLLDRGITRFAAVVRLEWRGTLLSQAGPTRT